MDMMKKKKCSKCKRMIVLSEFSKDARASDGLQSQCYGCCHIYDAIRQTDPEYKARKKAYSLLSEVVERRKAKQRMRVVTPEYRAYRRAYTAIPTIREKINAQQRARYKERYHDPDDDYKAKHFESIRRYMATETGREKTRIATRKRRELYGRPYRQTIRGRATEAISTEKRRVQKLYDGGCVTTDDWLEVLERYNHRCAYCGTDGDMTMDHIMPLSRGGLHKPENIAPACRSCNSMKHAATNWIPRIFRATEEVVCG